MGIVWKSNRLVQMEKVYLYTAFINETSLIYGIISYFPHTIDESIGSEDPVRVYDAFVDALNLEELGIPIQPTKAGAHE